MSVLILLITALIWGVAFVAQSVGMDFVGPFSFNASRFLIGTLSLSPLIIIRWRSLKKNMSESGSTASPILFHNDAIKGGICCGVVLCIASLFQQFGVCYTSVGKAGFITALYIIIVPFMGVILHQKIGIKAWIAAVIALVGFYLMCMTESLSIELGDGLVLAGAFFWSIHIMVVDYYAKKAEGIVLSFIQFLVSGAICTVCMFIFENPTIKSFIDCAIPILYAGVMSCGVAYTLQIIGQKRVKPSVACLVLSLESVFSALAAWVLMGQVMKGIEIAGCVLVFAGVVLAQLPDRKMEETIDA